MSRKSNPRASGIIFYRYTPTGPEYLIQYYKYKNKYWYSDFGGKVEKGDTSIEYTASRETTEETNCGFLMPFWLTRQLTKPVYDVCKLFSIKYIMKLIKMESFKISSINSQYILFLTHIPHSLSDNLDLGGIELHSKYKHERNILWITHNDFINIDYKKIHPRIRNFYSICKKMNKNISFNHEFSFNQRYQNKPYCPRQYKYNRLGNCS
jgi:8-oxo-dGTP pyrophosphatase MutT (NUDIX family)